VIAGEHVSLEREDHVAIVTLERPEALNAISGGVAEELTGAFRTIAADEGSWVVLLEAGGDRAFCVGADLKERATFSLADYHLNRRQMRGMFEGLRALPQPSIAVIFGFALGGGFELALSCDLVVAAEGTEVGLPEARAGLLPAGGAMQLLPRRVGTARAKDLILTGRRVDVHEAQRLGLVDRVVAQADLAEEARSLARAICECSPVVTRAAKTTIDAGARLDPGTAAEVENGAWSVVIASRDREEGIAAFNDKRAPRWNNR
jgi:enoyl-CoA hydratase/carnithine racemase